MISIDNFKEVLTSLNFTHQNAIYTKHFSATDTFLTVDFDKKELLYPENLKINERQTCNFASNENFVVFECVYRLLEKGYKPEHIELEPKWKLGHGASGGRADILVSDNDKNPLLLIECKTAGREFEKAWEKTLFDGDQLFSYAQQIPATQYLCLYTSDFKENKELVYTSYVIVHKDKSLILERNFQLKSFEKAKNVSERFEVWQKTYDLEFETLGIFEPTIQAYQIGKQKIAIEDLKSVDAQNKEGKYHEFRTALRKHNVSGREKAFDVLVNLFLCKIVDESENPKDLKFYWKGKSFDTYFDLIDRLQALYQIGMRKFLDQEIVYVSNEQIDTAFWTHLKRTRNATKDTIKEHFRKLKFFTNNDFGLIDVHNEKLFYQNAAVLLEIVQMWQDMKIKTEEHNQFLGDMFEFFLDNGIKQSEGQFFTPMPICKFILMSLPLENIVQALPEPPKVLDYACGAGHFLTEYATQVTPFVSQYKQVKTSDFYKQIFGIEKEYRLSKVAKLSSFMYGHDGIEILHNDALDAHPKIKPESFDILVANPPFAVEGFLDTLSEEQRQTFDLTQTVSEVTNNRNIQCFFIERAKQLLAPNGIAAIIIPSSILSNSDATHTATREVLLKYFDIVSLVELGSGTFGKTGTNTVVLFLRRKAQRPEPAIHYLNRVKDWFENWNAELKYYGGEYGDIDFVKLYCKHIQIPFDHYQAIFEANLEPLMQYEMFKEYRKEFEASSEVRNLKAKRNFKELDTPTQQAKFDKHFVKYAQHIEQDKLYYFYLAATNPQKVLVVKSPSDGKEQKQYLGYEWSAAKGSEGIKYNGGDNVNKIQTPLFDPQNRNHPDKISYFISKNFENKEVNENLPQYASYVDLVDLLDFSRKDFNKAFSLSPKKNNSVDTKWELVRLGDVAEIIAGQSPESKNYNEKAEGLPFYQGKKDFGDLILNDPSVWTTQITKESYKKDILMSVRAPVGDVNINPFERICIGRGLAAIRNENNVTQAFLFEFINQNKFLFKGNQGMAFDSISRNELLNIKIPLPPLSIQSEIVSECEKVDSETLNAKAAIAKAKKEIEELVATWFNSGYEMKKLDKVFTLEYGKGLPEAKRIEGEYPVMGSNGISGYHNDYLVESPAIIVGRKGSAGKIVYIDKNCYPIDTTFYVKPHEPSSMKYLYYLLIKLDLPRLITGIGVPGLNRNDVHQLQIPVPPISTQQELVGAIEKLEEEVAKYQGIVATSSSRKQAIMKKYL